MNKNRLASPSILLIYIIIVGLYHFFGYTGHFGFDDLHYAELASGPLCIQVSSDPKHLPFLWAFWDLRFLLLHASPPDHLHHSDHCF